MLMLSITNAHPYSNNTHGDSENKQEIFQLFFMSNKKSSSFAKKNWSKEINNSTDAKLIRS